MQGVKLSSRPSTKTNSVRIQGDCVVCIMFEMREESGVCVPECEDVVYVDVVCCSGVGISMLLFNTLFVCEFAICSC